MGNKKKCASRIFLRSRRSRLIQNLMEHKMRRKQKSTKETSDNLKVEALEETTASLNREASTSTADVESSSMCRKEQSTDETSVNLKTEALEETTASLNSEASTSTAGAESPRWWKIKRMQKELEEQQRIFLLEPPSVNVNLLHIKEELIEVEEPELVEIKHEPLDEAEDVISEDPLTVHIKEESSEGVEPEKRFPFVSLKVKSFTQGPLAGGSKFVPNVPQTIIEDKKIDNKEVDFMFSNFATRFKSLSGRTQLRVKAKISQILAEAEMDELNGQNSRQ